jgi:hypothetical protein
VEEETLRTPLGDDPEEVVERPQVLHCELELKRDDRVLKKSGTGRYEHDAINVDGVIVVPVDEHGRVRLGLDKAEGHQVGGEATVLGP